MSQQPTVKVHFLGTAAAEGFPAIFCRCEHCAKARALGGKNIRTRTSAIIDDVLKIDFPADTNHHVLRDGIDLGKVKELFFTHTHLDHLHAEDLSMRLPVYAHGIEYPLKIYGNDAALRVCSERIERVERHFEFKLLQPYVTVEAETATITPLLADHDKRETCYIFYIQRNGKNILYGHDTGWFPERTWAWLEDKKIDLAILDCTNGNLPYRTNHMNVEAVIETQQRFRDKGIFHEGSRAIATHFSHNIGLQYDDLAEIFAPHGIEVAYDGLIYHL